ncbi:MAG: hypothetical protein FD144_4782 [Rhodospirillaceae bacterium]|nr:MAG: hypothetical protein FD144_4782 [Rhodospirillaceae bacterium]
MTTKPSEDEILGRIDELECLVNGLMIYIAAKEAGIELDPGEPKTRDFLKSHLLRQRQHRLNRTGQTMPEDGFIDAASLSRIQHLVKALRDLG